MEYLRDCGINYLCCPLREEVDYRLEMILVNRPAGFLPVERRRIDEEESLYYQINGLLSLHHRLEKERLGVVALQELMESVERLCHSMEEYLLPFEDLLLDPEYIYVRPDSWQESYWVYYGEGNRSGEAFLEYLLEHLDYEDQQGVKLLYAIYQSCRTMGGGIEAVREAWRKERRAESEEIQQSKRSPQESEPVQSKSLPQRRGQQGWNWCRRKLAQFCEAGRNVQKCIRGERMEEMQLYREESSGTMLLTGGMVQGGIYCLRARSKAYPDLLLTAYPYFIGKDENKMDGVVEDAFVSRYHARIDREEENFRVMDLGSRNGTFLNRERLLPYDARMIQEGDLLIFAHREYEFCYLR